MGLDRGWVIAGGLGLAAVGYVLLKRQDQTVTDVPNFGGGVQAASAGGDSVTAFGTIMANAMNGMGAMIGEAVATLGGGTSTTNAGGATAGGGSGGSLNSTGQGINEDAPAWQATAAATQGATQAGPTAEASPILFARVAEDGLPELLAQAQARGDALGIEFYENAIRQGGPMDTPLWGSRRPADDPFGGLTDEQQRQRAQAAADSSGVAVRFGYLM